MFGSVGLVIAIAAAAAFFMMRDGGGEKISEQDLWISTLNETDTTSYISYLTAFPEGKFANEATDKLDSLRLIVSRARQAEVDAWSKAEAINTIAGFQTYVNKYADGKNVTIAQEKIEVLKANRTIEEAEEQKKVAAKEDKVWARCKRKNEIEVYEDYIIKYPEGRYTDQAKDAISDLKTEQDRLVELERLEQDQKDREAKKEQNRLAKEAQAEANRLANIKGSFVDPRDGQSYNWRRMKDGKKWMTQNLNFETDESYCYEYKSSNCSKYGRLYNWKSAINACPSGWKLPSEKDWKDMAIHYDGLTEYAKTGYNNLITGGESGFSAQLGGYRYRDGSYYLLGGMGRYWCSTVYDPDFQSWGYGFMRHKQSTFLIGLDIENAVSCRCIQDN